MKKKLFKRVFSLVLSACFLSGGMVLPVTAETVQAAQTTQQDDGWDRLRGIISQYYGEWNDTSYEGLFVPTMPKTALLGNGDVGVASGGNAESKTFYISKGDFWVYNGSPMPIGGVTIRKKSQETPDPQTASLAYQKTVTSSGDHPGYSASRAVNGQWAPGCEGWVSPVGNPQWMMVDLGGETTFNRFVVRHDNAARPNETANTTKNFTLQTSSDGSSWTNVYTMAENYDAISDVVLPLPVTARYVRLYIAQGTQETTDDSRQNPRARIGQFELYNNPDLVIQQNVPSVPAPKTSLALNKPTTSSGYHANLSPDRAVNGAWSPNSGYEGWTSGYHGDGQPGPWWLETDLGEPTTFNRFVVQHDGAGRPGEAENNTKDFQLQIRNSTESDWETVYNVEGNTASTTDITLDNPVTARYVRLYIITGTQGNTDDSRDNPRARIGQFELYNDTVQEENPPQSGETAKEIDLGGSFEISRYVIRLAGPGDIRIESSEDGSSWKTVGETGSNIKTVVDVTEDPFTARYIRVTGSTESNILEVSLFQTPGLNKTKLEGKLHEIQDILNAAVNTETDIANTPLEMQTWTSATENVIVTALKSKGDSPVNLQAQVWAKAGNQQLPVTAASDGNSAVVTRRTTIDSRDTGDTNAHVSKAALATKIIGAEGVNISSDNGAGTGELDFVLNPDQKVYIVTAVGGGGRTYDYQGTLLQAAEPEAQALNILNGLADSDSIQSLLAAHRAWWKDFWMTSNIILDTGDPKLNTLMKYYYAAQYILGCSIREDKVAPGLYSLWHTTDGSQWSSDYHLNYNFIATFYGVNSSNRTWMGIPAITSILDYVDKGLKNAGSTDDLLHIGEGAQGQQVRDFVQAKIARGDIDETRGIPEALLYPVSIGPWGMKLERGYSYYGQLVDAIFSSYPLIEYYNYTQDENFLPVMYDYLKKCIALYEAWLEEEDGRFVLYSAYNEGSWGRNSAVELALLKNALTNAIKAGEILNTDGDKRAEWQNILNNLAPQPTAQYKGKTIFSLAEKQWSNNRWEELSRPIPWDGNILPIESVIPGEQLGYYSPEEDLQIAGNTIDTFVEEAIGGGRNGAWSQYNNFPKIFANAVNVRYPAQKIVDNFALTIEEQMQKNLTIKDDSDFHGAEKSGATEAINNMLLLSDKGVMKVFPNWLNDRDAQFTNLREKGAFVVSSAYSGSTRRVRYVDLVSEAGKPVTMAAPWAGGITVTDGNGRMVKTIAGTAPNHADEITYTFDTEAGMKYHIVSSQADTPSGGGSGSNGNNTAPAAPAPDISLRKDGGTTTISYEAKAVPDPSTGVTGIKVEANDIAALVDKAKEAEGAGQKAVIEIKLGVAGNANTARVSIPEEAFGRIAGATNADVRIDTGTAAVTFDTGALSYINSVAGSGDISIDIQKADRASLAQTAAATIGDRPVYGFTVRAGNSVVPQLGSGRAYISIHYTPKPGEKKEAIIVYSVDDSGRLRTERGEYNPSTGTVDFKTGRLARFAVGYNQVDFKDVAEGAWYNSAVGYMAARGMVSGEGGGRFAPGKNIKRADFLVMAMNSLGIEPDTTITDNFADSGAKYYTKYLATAKHLGLVSGMGGNRFMPEETISRQDMFVMLYGVLAEAGELPPAADGKSLESFKDAGRIADYARAAMKLFAEAGIVSGSGENLNPGAVSTRSEAAQVLYNLLSE